MIDGYKTQRSWLKKQGIIVGTKVLVNSKANSLEDGWSGVWAPAMDNCIGKSYKVVKIVEDADNQYGILLDTEFGRFIFPHFVLTKLIHKLVLEPVHVCIETATISAILDWFDGNMTLQFYDIQKNYRSIRGNYEKHEDTYNFISCDRPQLDSSACYLPGQQVDKDMITLSKNMCWNQFLIFEKELTAALKRIAERTSKLMVGGYEVEMKSDGLKWKGIKISDSEIRELFKLVSVK